MQGVDGVAQVGTALAGGGDRGVEVLAAVGQVAAVDGEGGEQLGQCLGCGLVVGTTRQLADHPDQAGDLGPEHAVGDLALAVVHELP